MAAAAAAALLDELMGRNRNLAPNEQKIELNWEDPDYCKYYMVQFCPHDLFVNTRADLGACAKIHDDEVKRLFDESTSFKKIQYMDEFLRFCTQIMNEVNRKIEKGKQRLLLMERNDTITLTPQQTQRNNDQIALLSDKINRLVEEAQSAGLEGDIEKAQGIMKLCDQLKDERDCLKKVVEQSNLNATAALAAEQEKQMEVCEVCGAFLIVGDAQQRIDDHLMGKQHVGYARLKTAIEEITQARDKLRDERDKQREADRKDRPVVNRERERGDRRNERDREREHRDRNRGPDRHRQERDRDRDRDHRHRRHDDRRGGGGGGGDRKRDRSRDRDGKHRSHGKDKHKDRDHSDSKKSKHDKDSADN